MFSVLASAKIIHIHHTTRRQTKLSHNTLFFQIPSVSSEELSLPRLTRFVLSRLCCHGHSLLFVLISMQDKTEGEFFLQRSEPLRRAIFGTTSSIFDLRSRLWDMARLLSPQCSSATLSHEKGPPMVVGRLQPEARRGRAPQEFHT